MLKPGTKIRCVRDWNNEIFAGQIYTVTRCYMGYNGCTVHLKECNEGRGYCYPDFDGKKQFIISTYEYFKALK